MRILTIAPRSFPGASNVALHLESLGFSKHLWLDDQVDLKALDADLFLLVAWCPQYSMLLPHLKSKVAVLWTSTPLQSELTEQEIEIDYINFISGLEKVSRIWFGSSVFAGVFPGKGFYCPYPADPKLVLNKAPKDDLERHNIGFFSVFGNCMKNIYSQLIAVRLLQGELPDLLLATNGMSMRQRRFSDNIGLKYEDKGWIEDKTEYYRLAKSTLLNIHASITESFSYQAWESMLLGTPVLMSPTISEKWEPVTTIIPSETMYAINKDRLLPLDLVCPSIDNAASLKMQMKAIIDWPDKPYLERKCREIASHVSEHNNKIVKEILVKKLHAY